MIPGRKHHKNHVFRENLSNLTGKVLRQRDQKWAPREDKLEPQGIGHPHKDYSFNLIRTR